MWQFCNLGTICVFLEAVDAYEQYKDVLWTIFQPWRKRQWRPLVGKAIIEEVTKQAQTYNISSTKSIVKPEGTQVPR